MGRIGAWVRLAASPWRELSRGIERADSLAFDFHEWMYVQYDCGAVLIRDESEHRDAFAARPAYLAAQSTGLGGGEPWYCDYGTDLSRGFRALKVWSALRAHGSAALGEAITNNCRLAARMAERVRATAGLRLAAPVHLNVCCFSAAPDNLDGNAQDALNASIAQRLQLAGEVVYSTTRVADAPCCVRRSSTTAPAWQTLTTRWRRQRHLHTAEPLRTAPDQDGLRHCCIRASLHRRSPGGDALLLVSILVPILRWEANAEAWTSAVS